MLSLDARFMDTKGNGVGRWRLMYRAEDMREAKWYARDLIPTCQIRVRDRRKVVVGPMRCSDFRGDRSHDHS